MTASPQYPVIKGFELRTSVLLFFQSNFFTELFRVTASVLYILLTSIINPRIYNLVSVPQITRLLLGDAIISSKTDPHSGSKIEKRKYGKIENNKSMIKILLFIRILKQQSSILRCFSRL